MESCTDCELGIWKKGVRHILKSRQCPARPVLRGRAAEALLHIDDASQNRDLPQRRFSVLRMGEPGGTTTPLKPNRQPRVGSSQSEARSRGTGCAEDWRQRLSGGLRTAACRSFPGSPCGTLRENQTQVSPSHCDTSFCLNGSRGRESHRGDVLRLEPEYAALLQDEPPAPPRLDVLACKWHRVKR